MEFKGAISPFFNPIQFGYKMPGKRKRGVYGDIYSQQQSRITKKRKIAQAKRLAGEIARSQNYAPSGFVGLEKKFYDTTLQGAALTAPTDCSGGEHDESATVSACTIPQGDGESQRDGRRATVLSVHYKGTLAVPAQTNQTALDVAPTIFVAMILDKFTNKAQFSSEDVFVNPTGNGAMASQPMLNLKNITRFRVLKTFKIVVPQLQTAWDGTNIEQAGCHIPFDLYHSFGKDGLKILYSGTTETIANVSDNSVHLVAYTSQTQYAPQINYNCRTRFVG